MAPINLPLWYANCVTSPHAIISVYILSSYLIGKMTVLRDLSCWKLLGKMGENVIGSSIISNGIDLICSELRWIKKYIQAQFVSDQAVSCHHLSFEKYLPLGAEFFHVKNCKMDENDHK